MLKLGQFYATTATVLHVRRSLLGQILFAVTLNTSIVNLSVDDDDELKLCSPTLTARNSHE